MTDAIEVDEALLALKVAFLVLLYLFIWLIVRSATRDLKVAPQEASSWGPTRRRASGQEIAPAPVRLVVLASPAAQAGGDGWRSRCRRTSAGRGERPPARGRRLRLEPSRPPRPAPDGLWVEDVGSTNGTYVNGARVTTARCFTPATSFASARPTCRWRVPVGLLLAAGAAGGASVRRNTNTCRPQRPFAPTQRAPRRRRNEDAFVAHPRCSPSPTEWAGQAGELASRLRQPRSRSSS